MCAVSMVVDGWRNPQSPNHIPWKQVEPDTASQMLEVLKRLDAIDKAVGAIDCKLKELEKQKFIKKLKRKAKKK